MSLALLYIAFKLRGPLPRALLKKVSWRESCIALQNEKGGTLLTSLAAFFGTQQLPATSRCIFCANNIQPRSLRLDFGHIFRHKILWCVLYSICMMLDLLWVLQPDLSFTGLVVFSTSCSVSPIQQASLWMMLMWFHMFHWGMMPAARQQRLASESPACSECSRARV